MAAYVLSQKNVTQSDRFFDNHYKMGISNTIARQATIGKNPLFSNEIATDRQARIKKREEQHQDRQTVMTAYRCGDSREKNAIKSGSRGILSFGLFADKL